MLKTLLGEFPGGPVVKNMLANAGPMEDSTCHGATRLMSHNYESLCPTTREATVVRSPRTAARV